jgi:asparagine synthase (glutamine-hydrolysing)
MHDNIDINLMYPAEDEELMMDSNSLFDYTEAPLRNTSNQSWFEAILREQQKQGVKVILGGESGNFTFSWNGYAVLPWKLCQGKPGYVLRETLALSRSQQRPWWRVFAGQALLPLMPRLRWLCQNRDSLREGLLTPAAPWRAHSAIHPDFARQTRVRQRGLELGHDFRYTRPLDTREARWRMITTRDFSADLYAGLAARYGVEHRDPTGDRRLVEFCLSIPESQFLRGGVARRLAKRAFAGRLPREILSSSEKGLQAPDWFEHLNRQKQQFSREIQLLEKHPSVSRYLDVERLRHLIQNWPQSWDKDSVRRHYKLMLTRGIMTGRFIRWFEGDNQSC